MRDPKRIPEVLNQLKSLWSTFPDLRLGQLIVNVMRSEPDISAMDAERKLYYMEDDELMEVLRKGYSEVEYIENNKPNI